MPLPAEEIKKLIKKEIPDASIEIKDMRGDSNHYSAIIKSKSSFSWEKLNSGNKAIKKIIIIFFKLLI